MKEIINIIKEIKNMENAQQEENSEVNLGYTIDRRNSNNEKKYARTSQSTNKTYSNDAEGELLQQLDETKDIYEREKIIAKLKAMQKSKTPQKENLLQELYKKLDAETEKLKKQLDYRKRTVESNKKLLYVMKSNRDMLKDKEGRIKKEWQNAYEQMSEDMKAKIEENRQLNEEIKNIEQQIKDLETKNFDKILAEAGEKEKEDMITKVLIGPSEVELTTNNGNKKINIVNMSEEDKKRMNNLSKETLSKLEYIEKNGITVEPGMIRALLSNEKNFNDYLDACISFYDKNNKKAETQVNNVEYVAPEDFPEIEYDFRNLRKSDELTEEEKMEAYIQAKETIKMLKQTMPNRKVRMKISILDKIYFEIKRKLAQGRNTQKQLNAGHSTLEKDLSKYIKGKSGGKSWELGEQEKAVISIEAARERAAKMAKETDKENIIK